MTAKETETWLPNLVGGVSIWKLADDLNQARFFDGRLLVPETEGSDSLPARVVWEVEGLTPLLEARTAHPEDVRVATEELFQCLERVRKELSSEESGYRRFKDALTMPSLEGAGADKYFFDPKTKRVFVINWGASPRSLGAAGQLVFGYDKFEELVRRAGAGAAGAAAAGAGAAAAAGGPEGAAQGAPQGAEDKKKDEEKKDEAKKPRPWWFWALVALAVIGLVILLGYLLRGCSDKKPKPGDVRDAATSASASAAPSSSAPAADAGPDGGALSDAGADAGEDGGPSDAGEDGGPADGGDAGADGGDADGGKDGGKDGGGETGDNSGTPPENGKVYVVLEGGGAGSGSGSGSAGSGGGSAKPPKRPTRPIPFRSHFQPGATAWRITSGAEVVDDDFPPQMNNGAFEVYLKPGHTFSELSVEYKDKNGTWQKH